MTYTKLMQTLGDKVAIVDACLPMQLAEGLRRHGARAIWVPDVLGPGASDDEIIEKLLRENGFLLTRDREFHSRMSPNSKRMDWHGKPRSAMSMPRQYMSETTREFKIKRGMRMLFCIQRKGSHSWIPV